MLNVFAFSTDIFLSFEKKIFFKLMLFVIFMRLEILKWAWILSLTDKSMLRIDITKFKILR